MREPTIEELEQQIADLQDTIFDLTTELQTRELTIAQLEAELNSALDELHLLQQR